MTSPLRPQFPSTPMTVEEFLAWSEDQPGRYEMYEGQIYSMAAERASHAREKYAVQKELERALIAAGSPCHMLPDGMTVRVADNSSFEPDALVHCGEETGDDEVEVKAPVIVVEVISPSTRRIDATQKLEGYFRLPSIEHYLIISPIRPPLILHSRQADGAILTRLIHMGSLHLDPPGITLEVAKLFRKL